MEGILRDRVALVTGGAQGLGQAICWRLAREGCHVVVADLKVDAAEKTAADINQYFQDEAQGNRRAIAVPVDVTDEPQVAAMIDRTVDEFGQLDILVSNAGILIAGEIDEFPAAKWHAVIEVNLFGYFLCAKHAARVMKARQSGIIIQINSKSGK